MPTPIQPQTTSGGQVSYSSANAGGDTVAFGTAQKRTIVVRNGAGASITATLTGVQACNQGFTHNVTYTCAAGADTEITPPANTVDASGNVAIGYSSATTISVGAIAS